MSELINKSDCRAAIRWRLLAGVSALALTAYISSPSFARAEDTERPILWIELGGQLSELQDGQEAFAPPLMDVRPSIFEPSQKFEKPPALSIDEFAKISFQPDNSDWVFSASVRYGRSASKRDAHQQTYPKSFSTSVYFSGYNHPYTFPPLAARFADTKAQTSQSHAILDFQAGKDVGLGLFGSKDASSIFSVGVRVAQFSSRTNITLKSDPDWHRLYKYLSYPSFGITHQKWPKAQPFHSNAASLSATRAFHGIGPSLSWSASAPFAGEPKDGEISFDWGLNAALLFGRQKATTHHQTTGRYGSAKAYQTASRPITYQHPATPDHTRSRTVIVPNVGGFAGLSFKYNSAKLSVGYRADLFFNAMDGGIDTRKNENVGFYGPFASVSVGIGG
jgi:hypothetical protein